MRWIEPTSARFLFNRNVGSAHPKDLVWPAYQAKSLRSESDNSKVGVVGTDEPAVVKAQRTSAIGCKPSQEHVGEYGHAKENKRDRHRCGT